MFLAKSPRLFVENIKSNTCTVYVELPDEDTNVQDILERLNTSQAVFI